MTEQNFGGITPERMCEIATMALHKLMEDGQDAAQRFFLEEVGLEDDEMEFFGTKRIRKAVDIKWDAKGNDADLPTEVDIPWNVYDDDIGIYLFDEYRYLVEDSFIVEEES